MIYFFPGNSIIYFKVLLKSLIFLIFFNFCKVVPGNMNIDGVCVRVLYTN